MRLHTGLACWLLLASGSLSAQSSPSGRIRVHYIAADEVLWDYAPQGVNNITGRAFEGVQHIWASRGPTQIGTKYKKALFREYTDATFRTLKARPAKWGHLGFLGPPIHAEVGDTIRIVFRNNGSHPFTMHPHGVFYDKDSEGAIYADGTAGKDKVDDGVPPGGTHTYVWVATARSGPSHGEGSSALWMYHSHADESKDVNAGLIGPLIVTARGQANPDGSPKDVDREIIIAFAEIDENLSWYINDNIKQFIPDPSKVRVPQGPSFVDPFGVTNLKESINGFLYGNGPMPRMVIGERVRWYLMSTTNFELHAAHWHGNVAIAQHMRTDVITLGTMAMVVADMVVDNPGTWLFHCHIEPHMTGGMQARFVVEPRTKAVAESP